MNTEYTVGSGNVFADLGLPGAGDAQVKAELAIEIAATIKRWDLTQEQAAKLMGVDQARVSRIVRGHLGRYTIDSLLSYLTRLSRNVTIVVDTEDADHQGSVRVRAG